MFLNIGFALAGRASNPDAAQGLGNAVALPMMFLSGVFFSRDVVPSFLKPVSDYLPLTFLNDALRRVASFGATLPDIGGDVIAMAIWSVVMFVIAFRFFKLEA